MVKTIYLHELIGEKIEVVEASNPSNLGITGKIVDETKSTIKVDHKGKVKTLLKETITFKLIGKNQLINGKDIVKRPEERLKGK